MGLKNTISSFEDNRLSLDLLFSTRIVSTFSIELFVVFTENLEGILNSLPETNK